MKSIIDFIIDFFLLLFPIYFLFILNRKIKFRDILADFGIKKISFKSFFKHFIIVFLLLFFISLLINFIFVVIGISDLNLVTNTLESLSPFVIIYLLVVRVFLEEWFFRGFLVSKLGILASALIFSLAHFGYGSYVEVFGAFVLGLVLAYYYKKINNLWPLYAAHFAYNAIVILFITFG